MVNCIIKIFRSSLSLVELSFFGIIIIQPLEFQIPIYWKLVILKLYNFFDHRLFFHILSTTIGKIDWITSLNSKFRTYYYLCTVSQIIIILTYVNCPKGKAKASCNVYIYGPDGFRHWPTLHIAAYYSIKTTKHGRLFIT